MLNIQQLNVFQLTDEQGESLLKLLVGKDGKSAYQEWLDLGNQGSPQDFINSLSKAGYSVGQVTSFLNGAVPAGFFPFPADGSDIEIDPTQYPQLAPFLVDIAPVVNDEIAFDSFAFVDANNPSNSSLWTPSSGNPFLEDVEGEIYGFTVNEDGANPSITLTLAAPIILERLRAVGPSTGPLMGSGHTTITNDQGETSPIGQWSEWLETGFTQPSAFYTLSFNGGSTVLDTSGATFTDNFLGAQGLLDWPYTNGYQYQYSGTPFESLVDFGVPTHVDFIKLSQLRTDGTGWGQAVWEQHKTTHSFIEAWDGNTWTTLFDGALPQVIGGTATIPVNASYSKFRMLSEAADPTNGNGDGRLGQMLFYTSTSAGVGYRGVFERLYLFKKDIPHTPILGLKGVPASDGYTTAIFTGA
jgi:hypothetical protein